MWPKTRSFVIYSLVRCFIHYFRTVSSWLVLFTTHFIYISIGCKLKLDLTVFGTKTLIKASPLFPRLETSPLNQFKDWKGERLRWMMAAYQLEVLAGFQVNSAWRHLTNS